MNTNSDRAASVRLLAVSIALAAVTSLTACGGGGGSSSNTPPPPPPAPPPPPPAFTIQSTDPADAATGVSRTVAFAATFSAAASAPTVNSSSVTLRGPKGNLLAANVASTGSGVTLTPTAGALPGDTTYTVSFAPTIKDVSGRAIGGALTRTFTTSSQVWGATVTDVADVPDFNSVGQPAIAYDSSGNLLVAWHSAGLTTDTLYAARLNTTTGTWSAPTTLETVTNGAIASLNMVCGTTGDCYLAWTHVQSGSYRTAQIARFDGSTSTWGAPSTPPLTATNWDIISLSPVFDSAGNLTLLATTGAQIMAVRLNTAAQTWGPQNTYTLSASTMEVRAVMDPAGNISAAWVHDTPSSRWVYGGHYNASTSLWSAEQPIADMLNTSAAGSLWLTLDGANAVTVVFARGGFISQVYASRLTPATGLWGTSTRLDNVDPNTNSASGPKVVGDAAGYVTAVWSQHDGLWSSRFSPSSGTWTTPTPMSPSNSTTGGASGTFLAADVAGNVTATWSTDFGAAACRLLAKDSTWGPVTNISVPTAGSVVFTSRTMQTTTSATGDVAAAWYQRNDVNGAQQYKLVLNTLRGGGSGPQPSMARTLRFVARGKVRSVDGDATLVSAVLPLQFAVGDDVTYEFVFRSDAVDQAPTDPRYGIYAVQSISMKIGSNSAITRQPPHLGYIHITSNGPQVGTSYSVSNSNLTLPCTGSECIARQLGLQLTGAPTSYLATDALLTEPPDIALFGNGQNDRIMLLTLTLSSGGSFASANVWSTLDTIEKK